MSTCRQIKWMRGPELISLIQDSAPDLREALEILLNASPETEIPVASYKYGDPIVSNGELQPPCDKRGCVDCERLLKVTNYAPIPLSLMIDRCAEVFLESCWKSELRLVPLRVIEDGQMFGVFETLDYLLNSRRVEPAWNVSAGVRSVWIIAPLGNTNVINSLLNGRGSWAAAKNAHWELIRSVAHAEDWKARVLIFPAELVRRLQEGEGERAFSSLLQIGWEQSTALRHVAVEDARLQEQTSGAIDNFATPFGPLHDFSTLKHWLSIVTGSLPAFRALSNFSEPGGPFESFSQKLRESIESMYERGKLKSPYCPILLRPGLLNGPTDTGFYSFRYPSLLGPRSWDAETFVSIPFAYQKLIKELQHEWAQHLREPNVEYFVQPRPDRKPLNAGYYADDLPVEDLLPGGDKSQIFWASPFFVAGAKLRRVAAAARSSSRGA